MDRGKRIKWLQSEYNVTKAYMFMGYLETYQPMYDFFESLGYTLIFKPMNPNPKVPNKGNVDAELVLQQEDSIGRQLRQTLERESDVTFPISHFEDLAHAAAAEDAEHLKALWQGG